MVHRGVIDNILTIDAFNEEYYKNGKSQQELANEYSVSQTTISSFMKKHSLGALSKTRNIGLPTYSHNKTLFDTISEKDCWILGWILSDGCIVDNSIVFNLANKDLEVLIKIKDYFEYTGPIYEHKTKLNGKIHVGNKLKIRSHELVNKIINIGINKNKSLNEIYPKKILDLDIGCNRQFIKGIFEGDGSIMDIKSPCFQIVGTKELLTDIQNILVSELDLKFTKLTNNVVGKNHYALRYRGKFNAMNVMDWIYKDSNYHLDRKYNKYLLFKENI